MVDKDYKQFRKLLRIGWQIGESDFFVQNWNFLLFTLIQMYFNTTCVEKWSGTNLNFTLKQEIQDQSTHKEKGDQNPWFTRYAK